MNNMAVDKQDKCPFCDSKRIRYLFAESCNFLAIYNLAPILPGHSLIIPKKHIESILQLSDSELCEFVRFGRDVVEILKKAFKTEGFNWTIQEKEEAGQTIPHLHMHIIPRKPNDFPQPGDWYPKLKQNQSDIIDSGSRPRLSDEDIVKIIGRIKKYIIS